MPLQCVKKRERESEWEKRETEWVKRQCVKCTRDGGVSEGESEWNDEWVKE